LSGARAGASIARSPGPPDYPPHAIEPGHLVTASKTGNSSKVQIAAGGTYHLMFIGQVLVKIPGGL